MRPWRDPSSRAQPPACTVRPENTAQNSLDRVSRDAERSRLVHVWTLLATTPPAGASSVFRSLRRMTGLLAVAAVLLSSACSGDDDATNKASRTTTRTGATSTVAPVPTSSPTGDDAVIADLRSFWNTFLDIGGRTGAFDSASVRATLGEHTMGDEFTQLYNVFQVNSIQGRVIRGEIESAPKVLSNDGSTATVRDCYDDHTGIYRVSDGARLDSDDPARKLATVTLQFESGTWKVANIRDEKSDCSA